MSRWVNHEYEGAIAFLFITISTFLPWSVSMGSIEITGQFFEGRWWFGQFIQYANIEDFSGFYHIIEAVRMQQGQTVHTGYLMWLVGAVVFTAAISFGSALFMREEAIVNRFPVRFVAGGLLFGSGVAFLAATVWISTYGLPGTYVPVGALFQIVFGLVLLTNRYGTDASTINPTPDADS